MKFGLTQNEYEYITKKVVEPLVKSNVSLYCFGSRARNTFSKFSDLDLMIEGSVTESLRKQKSEIEEEISLGNFPYKVDLVFLQEFSSTYLDSYLKDRKPW